MKPNQLTWEFTKKNTHVTLGDLGIGWIKSLGLLDVLPGSTLFFCPRVDDFSDRMPQQHVHWSQRIQKLGDWVELNGVFLESPDTMDMAVVFS